MEYNFYSNKMNLPQILYTLGIAYRTAICPRGNLSYMHICPTGSLFYHHYIQNTKMIWSLVGKTYPITNFVL